MSAPGVVIVGGGHAGAQVAISLRDGGYGGPVTIVGNERGVPYQRPPLSKAFLLEKESEIGLRLRQPEFYRDHGVEILDGERVTEIDRNTRHIGTSGGARRNFTHLVLATGACNRALLVPGADLDGVVYLRTLGEARQLKQRLAKPCDIVVIGAGFIGLELAAVAAKLGARVSLVEATDRCMSRVVSPEVSSYFERQHRQRGVAFRFNDTVTCIHGSNGKVSSVETAGGASLKADIVIAAIGVAPCVELAERAGLAVQNGILVDDHLMTSDSSIFAVGDCAAYPNPFADAVVRLESVQNAVDHAKNVAAAICGRPKPFRAVPWFWSDQSEDKLQIAGIAHRSDQLTLIGDVALGRFSILRFRNDRLAAVESVNRVADHVAARKILQSGQPFRPDRVVPTLDLRAVANDNGAVGRTAAAT